VAEVPCVAVVGASGAVFGMAGVTLADMALNFETLARPLLRTAVLLAFLIFFAVTVGTTAEGTSHMSHVGGLLCGMLPALVLLPNVHHGGRGEVALVAAGAAGSAAIFVALPCIFYLRLLPAVCCWC
jgi:membrane associated rhomboid family serine protease